MKRFLILLIIAVLAPSGAYSQARLNTTQFIVIGEGIAAGMADFALRQEYQANSFPALMAKQFKTNFPQPLFEAPGIGSAPGYPTLPVKLPGTQQGSVRTPFPPPLFIFNLSVPGMTLSEALNWRPQSPLVQKDTHQTLMNMTLGYPALIVGPNKPLWTPVEYAIQMNPTIVLVELGYTEVLAAATSDDATKLPDVAKFRADMDTLLKRIKGTYAELIVLTIPDPTDTAYFTSVASAPNYVGMSSAQLQKIFRLKADDYLTPNGMMLLGNLVLADDFNPFLNPLFPGMASFFPGTVVSNATAMAVKARVAALNTEINSAARAVTANTYDLQAFFNGVRRNGLTVGTKSMTANFLGGVYSLDGYYPGSTAQALIANNLLTLLNTTYKRTFPMVDVNAVNDTDPAWRLRPAFPTSVPGARAANLPETGGDQ